MTSGTASRRLNDRQQKLDEIKHTQQADARRRLLITRSTWAVGLVIIAGLVTAALLSSRPVVSSEVGPAPPFTLPTSDGRTVSLSDFAGTPVILYFNEGAGCDACLLQMAEIEKEPGFADAGIAVVPIVMNTADIGRAHV